MNAPVLIMRLEGPLMSYGAPTVDNIRPTADFPALSMLTGLLAQALGWTHHSQAPLVQHLQERISYAARSERLHGGDTKTEEYQSADLDQHDVAWTTYGIPETRGGDTRTYRTSHIRRLQYLMDIRTTVAVALSDPEESPTVSDLAHALRFPASVLFIGRKGCLPSEPIFQGLIPADTLLEALAQTPSASIDAQDPLLWDGVQQHTDVQALNEDWQHDVKDWTNEIHTGRRWAATGTITNHLRANLGGEEDRTT